LAPPRAADSAGTHSDDAQRSGGLSRTDAASYGIVGYALAAKS